MRQFPIFMVLKGRNALVVGTGEVAERKAGALRRAGATIVQVAQFQPRHLRGCAIAIGAGTDDAEMAALYEAARDAGIPVNVVDKPHYCTFITPAIIDRDPILVAVSSAGTAPVLARILRSRIEGLVAPAFGRLALIADEFKTEFRARWPDVTLRRRMLERLLGGKAGDLVLAGRDDEARREFASALGQQPGVAGMVFLVGSGPGTADLQTLRTQRLLGEADVVVYDQTVPDAVVDMARRDSERVELDGHSAPDGESAAALLARLARDGRKVVRLTAGDGARFLAKGGEADALSDAGVAFEVVPGLAPLPLARSAPPPRAA